MDLPVGDHMWGTLTGGSGITSDRSRHLATGEKICYKDISVRGIFNCYPKRTLKFHNEIGLQI